MLQSIFLFQLNAFQFPENFEAAQPVFNIDNNNNKKKCFLSRS